MRIKNFPLKVWSLIIAVFIFYYVNSQQNSSILTIVAPIEIKNLNKNSIILEPKELQAEVTIRGASHLVSGIAANPPSIVITLPDNLGRYYKVYIGKHQLKLPRGIEVLNIQPNIINFKFDDLITKEVAVIAPRFGNVKEGYKLAKVRVYPAKIKLTGAKSILQNIKTIETSAIDLTNLTSSKTISVNLKLPYGVEVVGDQKIKAEILIFPIQKERTINNIPVTIQGAVKLKGYKIIPKSVNIEVSGPRALVNKLKKSDITPYIVIDNNDISPKEYPVKVMLPQKISLIDVIPTTVKLVLQKEKN